MTKEEAIKLLQEVQEWRDKEAAHIEADNILCELLVSLDPDMKDVVLEYDAVTKWYA